MPEQTNHIVLIQCPAWLIDAPPHGLSMVAAGLKEKGFFVSCFDLNISLYHESFKCNDELLNPSSWLSENLERVWNNKDNAAWLFRKVKTLYDEIINFIHKNPVLSIGFTVHYTSLHFTYLMVKKIKSEFPAIPVIWGGPYCFYEFGNLKTIVQKMPEVDVVCTGDGDRSFPVLMECLKNTSEFCNMPGYYIRSLHFDNFSITGDASGNLSDIPFAAFDAFDNTRYSFKYLPVWVSKACINRCAFCYECKAYKKYAFRNPEKIADEVRFQSERYQKAQQFWFTCSNIGGDIIALKAMCDRLIAINTGVSWVSQLAIHKSLDRETLHLMKKSGCSYLYFGIESGSRRILQAMNKHFTPSQAERIMKNAYRMGIGINFNLVVGFPGENAGSFIRSLWFIRKFIRFGITPSVATCKVTRGARLYRFHEQYNISNYKSDEWYCKQHGNTLKLRNKLKQICEILYRSRFLNIGFIAQKFTQYQQFCYQQKHNKCICHLKRFIAIVFDLISYVPFLPWVLFVFLQIKILSHKELTKIIAKDFFLQTEVSQLKVLLQTKINRFNEIESALLSMSDFWQQYKILKSLQKISPETINKKLDNLSNEELNKTIFVTFQDD